jgi:hypothetical protein
MQRKQKKHNSEVGAGEAGDGELDSGVRND